MIDLVINVVFVLICLLVHGSCVRREQQMNGMISEMAKTLLTLTTMTRDSIQTGMTVNKTLVDVIQSALTEAAKKRAEEHYN